MNRFSHNRFRVSTFNRVVKCINHPLSSTVGPQDSYEWGDISLSDIKEYQYFPVEWDAQKFSSYPSKQSIESSLATALNITSNDLNSGKAQQRQSILMLGCGNSKLGEEMVTEGNFKGPVVQVDVSSNVVETMRERCSDLVSKGNMSFVHDDATELSAFRDGMIDACLDKGLIDAIFCAEDFEQMNLIQNTVARVLRPGGSFVFFSFSRPEFILPKLMVSETSPSKALPWKNIEVQQLPKIMLYRMQKKEDKDHFDAQARQRLIRSKANKRPKNR